MQRRVEGRYKSGDETGVLRSVLRGDLAEDVGGAEAKIERGEARGRIWRVGAEGYGEDDGEKGRKELVQLGGGQHGSAFRTTG